MNCSIILLLLATFAINASSYRSLNQIRARIVSKTFNSLPMASTVVYDEAIESLKSTDKIFNWEKQWYPLAVEAYTDKNKTHPLMFLGNDVVLWNDGNHWRVFEDSCPHRGVPLSEGRVEKNGELFHLCE